jgi:hypothetical protein
MKVRLLLYNQKYAMPLIRMGLNHGRDFDCMKEDCPVDSSYRKKEKEQWDGLTEMERKEVHFGRIG